MDDSTQAMVDFLRNKYRDRIHTTESIHNAVVTGRIPAIDGDRRKHAELTLQSVHEAQSMLELFETTIVAHLGTAGPMGAIAEQQLRILARPFL
ncbi:hypothetical protein PUR71_08880 [Streptomyces sp. SP17BM10]|uniref:hypothetical protein n=1 Tax=Streptomyces sp. SP17BM10 TaxID=3002530 RepID=UPI002E79EC5F|nr:hypothetical protein [Streptomyces sp. SP17BM10]MEE1783028.1 hypothetical protein [Streptomyces sp. SP17BM10]